MGKLIIIPLLFLFSCLDDTSKPCQNHVKIEWSTCTHEGYPYQTLVIDSCEYIYVQNGNASWGAHKGSCKFCAERLKNKQIWMEAL